MTKATTTPKIIIVKIGGGLGNQLFQYATARRLAAKTGAKLKLDINDTFLVAERPYHTVRIGLTLDPGRSLVSGGEVDGAGRLITVHRDGVLREARVVGADITRVVQVDPAVRCHPGPDTGVLVGWGHPDSPLAGHDLALKSKA